MIAEVNPAAGVDKEVKDNVILNRETIEIEAFAGRKVEPKKQFHFWSAEYRNIDAAVDKYGDETVLAMFNKALANAIRAKARQALPDDEDQVVAFNKFTALANSGKELFTKQELELFIPGVREKTSPASLRKLSNEFKQKAIDAKNTGNIEQARTYLSEAKRLFEQAKQLELDRQFDLDGLEELK